MYEEIEETSDASLCEIDAAMWEQIRTTKPRPLMGTRPRTADLNKEERSEKQVAMTLEKVPEITSQEVVDLTNSAASTSGTSKYSRSEVVSTVVNQHGSDTDDDNEVSQFLDSTVPGMEFSSSLTSGIQQNIIENDADRNIQADKNLIGKRSAKRSRNNDNVTMKNYEAIFSNPTNELRNSGVKRKMNFVAIKEENMKLENVLLKKNFTH